LTKIETEDLGSYYDEKKSSAKISKEVDIEFKNEYFEKFPRLLKEEREDALKLSKDEFWEKIHGKYLKEFGSYFEGDLIANPWNWGSGWIKSEASIMIDTAWDMYRKGYVLKIGLSEETIKKYYLNIDKLIDKNPYRILYRDRKENDYVKGSYGKNKASSKKTSSSKSNNITEELKELKKLYKSGDLSKKQFEKAKDKLLK